MLGIKEIATYIPVKRESNYSKTEKFAISEEFINEKIGVRNISVKDSSDDTSDLCVKAFDKLSEKIDINPKDIDFLTVITQNPDFNIPQTSAIVHGKLDISEKCASFDVSLGCSGFVYGLSIAQSFMQANNLKTGLLFTADPYSKIVNSDDKNTSLLFGDASAVTLISKNPVFKSQKFSFGTVGNEYEDLICRNGKLFMNGRSVFNFAAKVIPEDIKKTMEINKISVENIDKFILHQGSLHIVKTISKRLQLPPEKVVFDAWEYGNTVSSSIPILIEKEMKNPSVRNILISGFGVGLSWASTVLKRNSH